MPDWIDAPGEIMSVLSIFGVIVAVVVFIIDSRVNKMLRELKPNGGSSMRDAIDRIERKQDRIETKIDRHIEWHLEEE